VRAGDVQRSAERADSIAQPDKTAGLRPGTRPADPVVLDLDDVPVSCDFQPYPGAGSLRVLDDVRQRFGTEKIKAGLDGRGQPDVGYVDLDGNWGPVGKGPDGQCQAMLGEDRGMQARSELAQLLDPAPGVLHGLAEKFPGPIRSGLPALFGKLKVDKTSDETLLGTVVQVPGNALARSVGCGNQARPRRYQVLLGTLAVGDVAHVGGEGWLSRQAGAGNGHLGRKLGAVGPHGRHLDPAVQNDTLPGLQVSGEAAPVRLPQRGRHDVLRKVTADHFLGPVAEGVLERAVHVRHSGVTIDADDGVESSFENGALPRLARGEHGRPRLGDLTFPVSLASQFRLRNAVQPGELNAEHCGGVLKCRQVSLGRGASGINDGDDAEHIGSRPSRH
jgi:hypothetical protein